MVYNSVLIICCGIVNWFIWFISLGGSELQASDDTSSRVRPRVARPVAHNVPFPAPDGSPLQMACFQRMHPNAPVYLLWLSEVISNDCNQCPSGRPRGAAENVANSSNSLIIWLADPMLICVARGAHSDLPAHERGAQDRNGPPVHSASTRWAWAWATRSVHEFLKP